ncbi:MAG: flavin reductase family protein [Myxococcales bacterium]|nr:flavin reductase family protein [Myxococcales bacterium]
MSFSHDELKNAYARWATGVTIVTARAGDRIHGMTVSAFTEVSLEPPLVLVCIDKTSNTQPVIAEGGVFAVNILARGQEPLAKHFACKETEDRRFSDLDCETGTTGAPLLAGSIASLDCRLVTAHEAGDHILYVGEVAELRLSDGEPLLFYRRGYCGLIE